MRRTACCLGLLQVANRDQWISSFRESLARPW